MKAPQGVPGAMGCCPCGARHQDGGYELVPSTSLSHDGDPDPDINVYNATVAAPPSPPRREFENLAGALAAGREQSAALSQTRDCISRSRDERAWHVSEAIAACTEAVASGDAVRARQHAAVAVAKQREATRMERLVARVRAHWIAPVCAGGTLREPRNAVAHALTCLKHVALAAGVKVSLGTWLQNCSARAPTRRWRAPHWSWAGRWPPHRASRRRSCSSSGTTRVTERTRVPR